MWYTALVCRKAGASSAPQGRHRSLTAATTLLPSTLAALHCQCTLVRSGHDPECSPGRALSGCPRRFSCSPSAAAVCAADHKPPGEKQWCRASETLAQQTCHPRALCLQCCCVPWSSPPIERLLQCCGVACGAYRQTCPRGVFNGRQREYVGVHAIASCCHGESVRGTAVLRRTGSSRGKKNGASERTEQERGQ